MNRIGFEKEDYFPSKGIKKMRKIMNDNGVVSGIDLIGKCAEMFDSQNIKTEILAASIRNKRQFRESILAGADIVTLPFKVIKSLLEHEKTEEGMRKFSKDVVREYAKLLGVEK
jgi:transaldolase